MSELFRAHLKYMYRQSIKKLVRYHSCELLLVACDDMEMIDLVQKNLYELLSALDIGTS